MWVTQRLPLRKTHQFFANDGEYQHLKSHLVMAVTFVLKCLFVDQYEVPYVWVHKRDFISHFDPNDPKSRFELLDLAELWLILGLGQKYRSLIERRKALSSLYERLRASDEYFESDILPLVDSIEYVADSTEWLTMKYKDKKQDAITEFRFHDDEEQPAEVRKHKMPSRVSAYEMAKKSIVSKLAEVRGNFIRLIVTLTPSRPLASRHIESFRTTLVVGSTHIMWKTKSLILSPSLSNTWIRTQARRKVLSSCLVGLV